MFKEKHLRVSICALLICLVLGSLFVALAETVFHIDVGLVLVSFTVKDEQGKYVSGLRPESICLKEDGIVVQRIHSFTEISSPAPSKSQPMPSTVFILFDTSNSMYDRFAPAEDEIADFIRSLDRRQSVAVYSFSRNMTRLVTATQDHEQAIRGMRTAVAGESTALLNAILLTLRDAARVPGQKVIVVFSNGPDDTSMVSPDDVARVAREEGIPIYIIATKDHNDTYQRAFNLISTSSGGNLFLAPARRMQMQALKTIEEDIRHTYTVAYYPEPNANDGWRRIEVQVLGDHAKRYKVTARSGYHAPRRYADGADDRLYRLLRGSYRTTEVSQDR